jgi:SAM-dependent methyltransferase
MARIEEAHQALTPDTYDIIVSRAVLEHLGDINVGWDNMVRCLKREGEMWHKVDFRCHKLYERIHPLYFLTFGELLWRFISRPDPTLNRARLPVYRDLLAQTFKTWKLYYTRIVNSPEMQPHPSQLLAGEHYTLSHVESVRKIRPQLKEPFSKYTDEELMVTGIFLSAHCKQSIPGRL